MILVLWKKALMNPRSDQQKKTKSHGTPKRNRRSCRLSREFERELAHTIANKQKHDTTSPIKILVSTPNTRKSTVSTNSEETSSRTAESEIMQSVDSLESVSKESVGFIPLIPIQESYVANTKPPITLSEPSVSSPTLAAPSPTSKSQKRDSSSNNKSSSKNSSPRKEFLLDSPGRVAFENGHDNDDLPKEIPKKKKREKILIRAQSEGQVVTIRTMKKKKDQSSLSSARRQFTRATSVDVDHEKVLVEKEDLEKTQQQQFEKEKEKKQGGTIDKFLKLIGSEKVPKSARRISGSDSHRDNPNQKSSSETIKIDKENSGSNLKKSKKV